MEYGLRPWVSWSFLQKTIIRQLRRWNESKSKNTKKYRQNTDMN